MKKTVKKNVKSDIISAAWRLFREKGYENTTIDDITELSDTSKGSFYYYFKSKDALLETLSEMLDQYYETLSEETYKNISCFDMLIFLSEKAHHMLETTISLELIASMYSTQLISKADRHLLDRNRFYYRFITSVIEKGQHQGEIVADKPASEIMEYYAMCERAIVTEWCLQNGKKSLAQYTSQYLPVMMEHFKASQ